MLFTTISSYSQNTNEGTKIDSVNIYLSEARNFFRKNSDSAKFYLQKAEIKATSNSIALDAARVKVYWARYADANGAYDKAMDIVTEAVAMYNELEKDSYYISAMNLSGYLHKIKGAYSKSIECFLEGIKEAKKQGNLRSEGVLLNNLANAYERTGNKQDGLDCQIRASEIYKELGMEIYYGQSLNNIASTYIHLDELEKGEKYLKRAFEVASKNNDYYGLHKIQSNQAAIEEHRQNYSTALEYYLQSLKISENMSDSNSQKRNSRVYNFISIARMQNVLGMYEKSIESAHKALGFVERHNQIMGLNTVYNLLYKNFDSLGQRDSAFFYMKKYLPIHHEYQEGLFDTRIEELNFELKLENEKENFETEKELLSLQNKEQQLFYLSLISLLGLMGLIGFLIWYSQKNKLVKSELKTKYLNLEKESLSNDIERKNKELTSTVLNLIERNKLIGDIAEHLEKMKMAENGESNLELTRLIRTIDKESTKKLWKEFELRYVEVHRDYFSKLNEQYPNLTSNERRLCAFIKLNMSSKEISSITYQSPQSLKIARYRLRKKIGLSRSENLNAFLNSI